MSNAAAVCDPVLLELYAGAAGRKDLDMIGDYEKNLPVLPCDDKVWNLAKEYACLFRSSGKTFSNFDILIFALVASLLDLVVFAIMDVGQSTTILTGENLEGIAWLYVVVLVPLVTGKTITKFASSKYGSAEVPPPPPEKPTV